MPSAKVVANGAELDLKALTPDADGDGHVTVQEKEIYAALKAADVDGTGTIGLVELYAVIGNLVGERKKVKGLSKLVVGLILLLASGPPPWRPAALGGGPATLGGPPWPGWLSPFWGVAQPG